MHHNLFCSCSKRFPCMNNCSFAFLFLFFEQCTISTFILFYLCTLFPLSIHTPHYSTHIKPLNIFTLFYRFKMSNYLLTFYKNKLCFIFVFFSVVSQKEYNLPEVKDRQFLIAVHKKAKKIGFDINRYNQLRDEAFDIESNLRRIRDPMYLRSSPNNFKANQTGSASTNNDIIQMALATNPNETPKKSFTDSVASIFDSTMKKFKK